MSFLERVLEPPSYGFERDGLFYKPTAREIFSEFFSKTNIAKSRKNWLQFLSWTATLLLVVPFFVFVFAFFSWKSALLGLTYAMVVLGTHGTIYLHRYSTHRAYRFRNSFARFVVRNLSIKIIPEEVYVISHHVHHHLSEQKGDPYNVHGGWLYCFLADATHQGIAKELSEKDYERLKNLMNHTGVKLNSYGQYRKWGTLSHPARTAVHFVLNWAFWFGVFFLIGGYPLAFAMFGMSAIWAFGVRTFNYDGHGGGKDKRQDGIDFNREDLSINQLWPGYVSGEWHNNHHLYPTSARAGFLPYQMDLAWYFIRFYSFIGGIGSYRDCKEEFLKNYYLPYRQQYRQRCGVETLARDQAVRSRGNQRLSFSSSTSSFTGLER